MPSLERPWHHPPRGFTLVELLVALALVGILAGVAVPMTSGFVARSRVDSSVTGAITAVKAARDRAVSERRNVQLNFVGTNRITVQRHEVPGPTLTQVDQLELEEHMQFAKFEGVPDTPDGFGNATAIVFTGTPPVMFTSDGSLIDSNGDIVNGTILLGRPPDVMSARAITIYGITGLVQDWRWTGSEWVQ
jgi:prepilin-type N-terminal cleavage/methylation domain-containing protein